MAETLRPSDTAASNPTEAPEANIGKESLSKQLQLRVLAQVLLVD